VIMTAPDCRKERHGQEIRQSSGYAAIVTDLTGQRRGPAFKARMTAKYDVEAMRDQMQAHAAGLSARAWSR
jgi:hypothetical protein